MLNSIDKGTAADPIPVELATLYFHIYILQLSRLSEFSFCNKYERWYATNTDIYGLH